MMWMQMRRFEIIHVELLGSSAVIRKRLPIATNNIVWFIIIFLTLRIPFVSDVSNVTLDTFISIIWFHRTLSSFYLDAESHFIGNKTFKLWFENRGTATLLVDKIINMATLSWTHFQFLCLNVTTIWNAKKYSTAMLFSCYNNRYNEWDFFYATWWLYHSQTLVAPSDFMVTTEKYSLD